MEWMHFRSRRSLLSVSSRGNRVSKARLQKSPQHKNLRWTFLIWLRSLLWQRLQSYHNLDKIRVHWATDLRIRERSLRLWLLQVEVFLTSLSNVKVRKEPQRQLWHLSHSLLSKNKDHRSKKQCQLFQSVEVGLPSKSWIQKYQRKRLLRLSLSR